MSSFGSGLGTVIGSSIAAGDLSNTQNNVSNEAANFNQTVSPYVNFGTSMLPQISTGINNAQTFAGNTQSYNDFMKNYQTSPGATYQMGQATEAQNNSAAASGQLLSGANERALSGINQGIANTYANQAYTNYLAGNSQQFGQLEGILGNMFQGAGLGTTATGQEGSVLTSQMGTQSNLAQAQAKNDQSKGSGIGSIFSGLGSIATMF